MSHCYRWPCSGDAPLSAANLVACPRVPSFFATIFQASLFMQQVLGYSAIRTGVALHPDCWHHVVIAAASPPWSSAVSGPGHRSPSASSSPPPA